MKQRVASLGMYDHPAQHDANDRIWAEMAQILRANGVRDVPARLDRDRPLESLWRDPGLLLGQTCGYPLITEAGLPLRIVALPVYTTAGSAIGYHSSLIVARRDDPAATLAAYRGRRAAINDPHSNTGMNLFRARIAPMARGRAFFSTVLVTGSHRGSLAAIAAGHADIAAIDAVSYAALDRFEPGLTRDLRIIARTPASPTLPFVTSRETPIEIVAILRFALDRVMAEPALADARATLFLTGLRAAEPDMLASIGEIERQSIAEGYPVLA